MLSRIEIEENLKFSPENNSKMNLGRSGVGKCASDALYTLKDWCDISSQQQQSQQQFHHQALYQKGGWNNFGSISDLNPVDPAIVSSRLLPFQSNTSTWQFPHAHPSHNTQQVLHSPILFPKISIFCTNEEKKTFSMFGIRTDLMMISLWLSGKTIISPYFVFSRQ